MRVYQVIKHGLTYGRDSGYPTITPYGPLFGTRRAAQDEADRLLVRESKKTMWVTQINPSTGTYDFNLQIEKPLYEVVEVPVLTQAQADERQREFEQKIIDSLNERAARLEAEAAKIRSAWKDGYA